METQIWQDDSLVLLIGNVDHEGVRSSLFQSGRHYKKKILNSKPANWQTIIDLFDSRSVSSVLVKLTSYTYQLVVREEYLTVAESLFARIATVPHMIYVYEGLYTGQDDEDYANELAEFFGKPQDIVRDTVNAFLDIHSLNVSTYRKNSEVTILAQAFLAQCETGLLLRLYVPNRQLWANETDKLLQLFRDYLTRVASVNVRLDETRTSAGVIYELHDDPDRTTDISTEFEEFSHFMNLCVSDSDQAQMILHDRDISPTDVMQILTRYAKEARRLQVDMRHEREQRVLHIRHQLESELLDTLPSNYNIESLGHLVDAAVPTVLGPRTPLLIPEVAPKTQNVTLNINPQFVETVNGVIAQEISGDVALTSNDRELFYLFAEYAGEQQAELVSALRELNDESAPKPGRLTAKQKINKFLLAVGSKATDVGVGVLQSYIEKTILGP